MYKENLFIKISIFLFVTQSQCDDSIFNPTTSFSTTTDPLKVPQYKFHQYIRDEKTISDYKTQEEHRIDDLVTKSYVVGESNSNLHDVKYVPDVTNGFSTEVNAQTTTPPLVSTDERISFNNQRTGISPPPKYHRKLQRVNPIIVKSTSITQPPQIVRSVNTSSYNYFIDIQNGTSNTPIDSNMKKSAEMFVFQNEKLPSESTSTEITTESIMKILNNHEGNTKISVDIDSATTLPVTSYILNNKYFNDQSSDMLKIDLTNLSNEDVAVAESSVTTVTDSSGTLSSDYKKFLIPQRPMRLIGLNPVYLENSHVQTITNNLTSSIPQIHLESIPRIPYATTTPFIGHFFNGPAPMRNVPRSVSDVNTDMLINSVPIVKSAPISPLNPSHQLPYTDLSVKQAVKNGKNKVADLPTVSSLCTDCLLPQNYIPDNSKIKISPSTSISNAPTSNYQKPCTSNNVPLPYWTHPYTSSLTYVLMPTHLIKGKVSGNEHPLLSTVRT